MSHHHDITVPRGPLLGAAVLIGICLLAVAAIRLSGIDISQRSNAAVVAERTLRFEDRPDGSIVVLDARLPAGDAAAALQVLAPGSNGFLRGTLRALVRERRRAGFGPEMPFQLQAHADGRLTLQDPATTQRVDLESFGPTNAAVFARLLTDPRAVVAAR